MIKEHGFTSSLNSLKMETASPKKNSALDILFSNAFVLAPSNPSLLISIPMTRLNEEAPASPNNPPPQYASTKVSQPLILASPIT